MYKLTKRLPSLHRYFRITGIRQKHVSILKTIQIILNIEL